MKRRVKKKAGTIGLNPIQMASITQMIEERWERKQQRNKPVVEQSECPIAETQGEMNDYQKVQWMERGGQKEHMGTDTPEERTDSVDEESKQSKDSRLRLLDAKGEQKYEPASSSRKSRYVTYWKGQKEGKEQVKAVTKGKQRSSGKGGYNVCPKRCDQIHAP